MTETRRRHPLQGLKTRLMPWLRAWLQTWRQMRPPPLTERQQAQALVDAVDAGGLPLNPARVNQIARQLGLEVSTRAPVEETIKRIRAALARSTL
jgi:hypothetical protein